MGVSEDGLDVVTSKVRRTVVESSIDWAERLFLAALYGVMVMRIAAGLSLEEGVAGLLTGLPMLLSEGLIVVFVLFRRPAIETSRRFGDWILACSATCTPLLVEYPGRHPVLPIVLVGLAVWMSGLIVQVHAKLTLRWSFGCVPAHRGLVLIGPYQFVRHPMYAGYALSHVGILIMNPSAWNLVCYIVGDGLQVPRILAEERLLSRDPRYREYRVDVRYRLIPGLY